MPLKSRNMFPPNGWAYYQPETNWQSNPNVGFSDVVQQIIEHRKANPRFNLSTDVGTVERELEQYTEARLRSQFGDGASEYLINSGSPPPSFTPPRLRRHQAGAVAGVGAKVERIRAGIGLMIDWLGDGLKSVDQERANQRATVCATCEFNQRATLLEQLTTNPAAAGIKSLLEERVEMKLSTPHDEGLQMCKKCDCVLKLKVFTPFKHVLEHTSKEVMDSLPSFCWIKSEAGIST